MQGVKDNSLAPHSLLRFDATVSRLTQKYSFTLAPQPTADALYTERTAQGYACITPRHPDDEETPLNLELLYSAVQNGKIEMKLSPTDANK